jgi:hypothetical protein
LSPLNYFPKEKTDKYKLKLFNKYQTIRTLKWKEAFLNKQNLDNISIRKGAYSYADRQKFMKRLQKMELIKNYIRENSLYETDNYIYGHFHVKNGGYDWNTSLHFFDRYRENVFGLPL